MNEAENQVRGAHEVAVARLAQTREAIAALRDQESQILMHIRDCEAAARLFGFEFPQLESGAKATENVREFALHYLSQAPEGTRTSTIKKAYQEQFRKHLHPKTIGMTLYRLKLDGLAERQGHVWRSLPHQHS